MKIHKILLTMSALSLAVFSCNNNDKRDKTKDTAYEEATPNGYNSNPSKGSSGSDFSSSNANQMENNENSNQPTDNEEDDTDQSLLDNIRSVFINDKSLSSKAKNAKITILNGTLLLEGTVANDSDKIEIEKRLKNVQGVRKIDNKLIVNSTQNTNYYNRQNSNTTR